MALYDVDQDGFDDAAMTAEGTRQAAMRTVTNQIAADHIHCEYFLTVINAGIAFNVTVINERTAFVALDCGNLPPIPPPMPGEMQNELLLETGPNTFLLLETGAADTILLE